MSYSGVQAIDPFKLDNNSQLKQTQRVVNFVYQYINKEKQKSMIQLPPLQTTEKLEHSNHKLLPPRQQLRILTLSKDNSQLQNSFVEIDKSTSVTDQLSKQSLSTVRNAYQIQSTESFRTSRRGSEQSNQNIQTKIKIIPSSAIANNCIESERKSSHDHPLQQTNKYHPYLNIPKSNTIRLTSSTVGTRNLIGLQPKIINISSKNLIKFQQITKDHRAPTPDYLKSQFAGSNQTNRLDAQKNNSTTLTPIDWY